jgi:hypothetical protein
LKIGLWPAFDALPECAKVGYFTDVDMYHSVISGHVDFKYQEVKDTSSLYTFGTVLTSLCAFVLVFTI